MNRILTLLISCLFLSSCVKTLTTRDYLIGDWIYCQSDAYVFDKYGELWNNDLRSKIISYQRDSGLIRISFTDSLFGYYDLKLKEYVYTKYDIYNSTLAIFYPDTTECYSIYFKDRLISIDYDITKACSSFIENTDINKVISSIDYRKARN